MHIKRLEIRGVIFIGESREEVFDMAIQCTAESPCVAMQLLARDAKTQEDRIDKMECLIEAMRNRLPLWATMALTASGAVIGILVGLLTKG